MSRLQRTPVAGPATPRPAASEKSSRSPPRRAPPNLVYTPGCTEDPASDSRRAWWEGGGSTQKGTGQAFWRAVPPRRGVRELSAATRLSRFRGLRGLPGRELDPCASYGRAIAHVSCRANTSASHASTHRANSAYPCCLCRRCVTLSVSDRSVCLPRASLRQSMPGDDMTQLCGLQTF